MLEEMVKNLNLSLEAIWEETLRLLFLFLSLVRSVFLDCIILDENKITFKNSNMHCTDNVQIRKRLVATFNSASKKSKAVIVGLN